MIDHSPELNDLISQLIQGDPVTEGHLRQAVEHMAGCPGCRERLRAAVALLTGVDAGCALVQGEIPLLIDSESARESLSAAWEHVQNCRDCRELFDDAALLAAHEREFGLQLPTNTVVVSPGGKAEPAVTRLTRLLKLHWENNMPIIGQLPSPAAGRPLFSPIRVQSWAPAYLDSEDVPAQHITLTLQQATVSLTIMPCTDSYDVSVGLSCPAWVQVLTTGDQAPLPIAGGHVHPGGVCRFAGLPPGRYEIHADLTGASPCRYEIPLELDRIANGGDRHGT